MVRRVFFVVVFLKGWYSIVLVFVVHPYEGIKNMIFIHVVGTFRIPFCIRKEIARKLICMCIYETNQRRKAIQTARDKKSKAKAISPQFLLETDLRHWQGHSGFLSGGIEKIPFEEQTEIPLCLSFNQNWTFELGARGACASSDVLMVSVGF